MIFLKNIFYLIVLITCLTSCGNKNVIPDCICKNDEIKLSSLNLSDDSFQIYAVKQKISLNGKPFNGKIIDCYEDKIRFRGISKEGLLNGPGIIYSENITMVHFKNGLLDGKWKSFSNDSTLIEEGHFKNHKQHGKYRSFLNGRLWQEGEYKNDYIEGRYYIYKENGNIDEVIEFKNGIVKNCVGDCDEFSEGDDDYGMGYPSGYYIRDYQ